jgi:heme oxygenase
MRSALASQMTKTERGHAHECLRASTCALHKKLDSRFDPGTISSPSEYLRFMLANWPIASIEVALEIAGIHRILPDWNERRRRDALAGDLIQLGVSFPCLRKITIGSDHGTLLGWSYVSEGSRLGAHMILRAAINGHANEQIMSATKFLRHGVGEHLWDSYRATLARIDGDPVAISKACAGAEAAFKCFAGA